MKLWRTPFDHAEKAEGPTRILIDKERCKGCAYCVEFCPKDVLENSEKFNRKGYHPPRVAHPDKCTTCDACEMICPDFAIFTVKLADAASGEQNGNEESK